MQILSTSRPAETGLPVPSETPVAQAAPAPFGAVVAALAQPAPTVADTEIPVVEDATAEPEPAEVTVDVEAATPPAADAEVEPTDLAVDLPLGPPHTQTEVARPMAKTVDQTPQAGQAPISAFQGEIVTKLAEESGSATPADGDPAPADAAKAAPATDGGAKPATPQPTFQAPQMAEGAAPPTASAEPLPESAHRTEAAMDPAQTRPVEASRVVMQPAGPQQLSAASMRQIADMLQTRPDAPVEITMNPEELGRVRMALNQVDGVLTVSILADQPQTLELFRRHADMLQTELTQMGFGMASFDFGQPGGRDTESGTPGDNLAEDSPQTRPGVLIDLDLLPRDSLDIRL
ncbi:flagellar hook-length control protein FliK [Actibacterium ureilyticum]|uniref:flagellar hook-length control protein FliK n=1 Tax=Actibacterium ureilyticum TaxID=1590614 RepID=UPI000BAADB21|nr:flagellar hook-length control protein FliK [Actibacterium ureilyticum]